MANSRINKFIFQQCHSFLRLRTVAKDLKIVKTGTSYNIEIPKAISPTVGAIIPVVCLTNVNIDILVSETSKALGVSGDDQIKKTEWAWGELVQLHDSQSNDNTYLIFPRGVVNAVKVGPIPHGVESDKLEIDWQNLQWMRQIEQ